MGLASRGVARDRLCGGPTPYVGRVVVEEAYLVAPRSVLSCGTVDGIPWSLISYTTKPGRQLVG